MFRYELQSINKKHYFRDSMKDPKLFGRNPLSTYEGVPVKDKLKENKGGKD
jgi:hypothetical protein